MEISLLMGLKRMVLERFRGACKWLMNEASLVFE